MNKKKLTTDEVAELAKCSVDTVKRACQDGYIEGAKKVIIKNAITWQIPSKAVDEWIKWRVPLKTRKRVPREPRTANIRQRTSPAPGSIPVTGDKRPLGGKA